MDRLQAIRTFVRVVESGSFSAAAREAQATQSAASKQVAALERLLGARLLVRTTRSLALTAEGERYFEEVRRLVAEMDEAERALRAGQHELTGWLRVAATVVFGRITLLPLIQEFQQRHPAVKIDLRLDDGFVDLVRLGIDLAIRAGELPDSTLVARRIGTTRRRLVAHRDYLRRLPRRLQAPRHPDDLLQHDCIVYTELRTGNAWTFRAGRGAGEPAGTERVVRVRGRFQTNSGEALRAAVLRGMGIAYAPDWLFEPELASGEIRTLLPRWGTPPLPIQLVSPAQRQHSAKVKAFAAQLAASLSWSGAA
jgi:DNA-binding transcriptional LysR family regulator